MENPLKSILGFCTPRQDEQSSPSLSRLLPFSHRNTRRNCIQHSPSSSTFFFIFFFILPQRLNSLSCRFYFVSSKAPPHFPHRAINIILENDETRSRYCSLIQFSRSIRQTYPSKLVHRFTRILSKESIEYSAIFQINVRLRKKTYSKFSDCVETWEEN